MTDSALLTTQNAVPIFDLNVPSSTAYLPPSPAGLTNGHITQEEGEGEDYTIKCICSFQDDDGNTVMCDRCETWQHVACYYINSPSPGPEDVHLCQDCSDRPLDARLADEIQRRNRGASPVEVERKPKKPGPKPRGSRKSKSEILSHTNGVTNGHGSPRNGTEGHVKRPRARHQSSSSTTVLPPKLPQDSTKRANSASHAQLSPIKSPGSPSTPRNPNESFSPEFMRLYEDDQGQSSATVNEFDDIGLAMKLGDWVRDEQLLAEATGGKKKSSIFVKSNRPVNSQGPQLHKHTKVDHHITAHGLNPKWIYLTVEQDVAKDEWVGELHGKIGTMAQYTDDPANRWEYLRHPLPFVFFHPQLPLIIDTREEGSIFRYLRRSCNPNLTLRTSLEEGLDYHFWFTATRDIEAGAELSIGWTMDEHTRRFFANPNEADADEEYVANFTRKLLADFGRCACNDPLNCTMETWAGWNKDVSPPKARKGRKKGQQSRSGSEAVKHMDEDDMEDETAASTSSHSKPQSRDITPSSLVDTKNILGEPISEREKRKIAALEKSEHEKHLPASKKQKRKSADNRQGSTAPPTPGPGKRGSTFEVYFKPTSSPITETSQRITPGATPSPLNAATRTSPPPAKPTYTEAAVQADLDDHSPPRTSTFPIQAGPKRYRISLHRHVFRRSILKSECITPKILPVTEKAHELEPAQEHTKAVEDKSEAQVQTQGKDSTDAGWMPDASEPPLSGSSDTSHSPSVEQRSMTLHAPTAIDKIPSIGTASSNLPRSESLSQPMKEAVLNGNPKPNLHIEMPPPIVHRRESTTGTIGTPNEPLLLEPLTTPDIDMLGAHSNLQPPGPSPVKKKTPYKEYLARKQSERKSASKALDAPGTEVAQEGPAAKVSTSGLEKLTLASLREEVKNNGLESNAIETPQVEGADPMVQQ